MKEDEARLELAWRVAPATIGFVLRLEAAGRNTRDMVDGLMLAAIQATNVSAINNDPDLQVAYATLPQAPPEGLRRPVSVSAIAHSLRMPFETARRRVQALARVGALEVTPRGVLVSHQALDARPFLASAFLRHERLKAFYFELKDLGAAPAYGSGPPPAWREEPIRLTNRLIWEYILRIADTLGAAVGDATNGVILLAMVKHNTEDLTPEDLAAWARDPGGRGRPVRNGKLAAELNFSTETLRRYVIALEARGWCRRGPLGLVATAPASARPLLDSMALESLANLQRLFGRLSQFGVLSMWEAPVQVQAMGSCASR